MFVKLFVFTFFSIFLSSVHSSCKLVPGFICTDISSNLSDVSKKYLDSLNNLNNAIATASDSAKYTKIDLQNITTSLNKLEPVIKGCNDNELNIKQSIIQLKSCEVAIKKIDEILQKVPFVAENISINKAREVAILQSNALLSTLLNINEKIAERTKKICAKQKSNNKKNKVNQDSKKSEEEDNDDSDSENETEEDDSKNEEDSKTDSTDEESESEDDNDSKTEDEEETPEEEDDSSSEEENDDNIEEVIDNEYEERNV